MDRASAKVRNFSRSLRLQSLDIQLMLEEHLKTHRVLECISLENFEIDEKWLNILGTLKKRHRTDIHFLQCNFTVSLPNLVNFVAKFNSVKIEFSAENTLLYEKITDQVICSLMPYVYIRYELTNDPIMKSPTLPLTDKTLKEVQSILPSMFSVGAYFTNFTVPEIIKTIKSAMSNLNSTPSFWLLGNVRARSRDEMIWAANELRAIKGVEVEEFPSWILATSNNPSRGYTVGIHYAENQWI